MEETGSQWLAYSAIGAQMEETGEIGRLEIKGTTGWYIPQRTGKWRKPAASGWRDRSFGKQRNHWLAYSAEDGKMEETGSQWLARSVVWKSKEPLASIFRSGFFWK